MQLSIEDLQKIKESDPELFKELVMKLADEAALAKESPFVEDMFGPQLAFFKDPSKRKAALCSRRAGKTYGLLCWFLEGARDCPNGLSVYIALSRNSARLILWATAIALNDRYKLGLWFRERDNQLIIQTENGHQIWLAGCKDKAEIEKFRGIKLRRAAVDEAASFPDYLRDLVFDVLDPALLDLQGDMALIGTPGVVCAGLFFEITTGQGHGSDAATKWSCHEWTVLENPHIPHAEEWLANKRKENRWDETHPRYVREWLGRWVQDDTSLVFPYNRDKNSYLRLPEGEEKWIYAIGVDVGYADESAFVVGAYRRNHPEIYILEVIKQAHLIPSALCVKLLKLQEKWGASQIVMDCGGIGKAYAEEASQRYGMYIEAAEKTKKRAFVEIVRGELISGVIRLNPRTCEPLIHEMDRLCFNEDMSDYDDVHDDHACFVAGTLISTSEGDVPIEDIVPGMLIYTRYGLRRALIVHSIEERKLCLLQTNHRTLVGTADHLIFSPSGKTPLSEMKGRKCLLNTRDSMGAPTVVTQTPRTGRPGNTSTQAVKRGSLTEPCIDTFGSSPPAVSCRRGGMSTTSILTPRTIIQTIWRQCRLLLTLGFICRWRDVLRSPSKPWKSMLAPLLQLGTGHRQVARCTHEMLQNPGRETKLCTTTPAKYAVRHFRPEPGVRVSALLTATQRPEKIPGLMTRIASASGAGNHFVSTSTYQRRHAGQSVNPHSANGSSAPSSAGTAETLSMCQRARRGPESSVLPSAGEPTKQSSIASSLSVLAARPSSRCLEHFVNESSASELVTSVRELGTRATVYGLTVEGEAEYFANGILVSNCDAFLYLVRSLLPSYRPYVTEEPMTHAEFVMKQQTDARRDALRQVRKELKRKMKHGSVIADIAMGN